MLNNVVLDVFIGLIFVFLLYSLLATILQEFIASRFSLRAKMLQKAMRRMLQDDNNSNSINPIKNYLDEANGNAKRLFGSQAGTNSLLGKFYNHPTIKFLGEGKLFKKPSYLHGHNFSQTIIHLLRGEDYDGRNATESELIRETLYDTTSANHINLNINTETLKHLKMLFSDARQDSYLFKQKLEDWFEETMERTTGWYKKQNQVILVWLGFAIAWAFNVDSIAITKILMKDKKVREQMVQMAMTKTKEYNAILDSIQVKPETYIKEVADTQTGKPKYITVTKNDTTAIYSIRDKYYDSVKNSLQKDAHDVQGILGLSVIPTAADSLACKETLDSFENLLSKETDLEKKKSIEAQRNKTYECCLSEIKKDSPYQESFLLKILGWFITALAISLGAPFWFDLLNKFIKLRESGPKAGNTAAADTTSSGAGSSPIKDNNGDEIQG